MEGSFGESSYKQQARLQERSHDEGGTFARDPSVRRGAYHQAILVLVLSTILMLFGKYTVGKMLHKTKGIQWETPADSLSLSAKDHVNEFFPTRMSGAIVMAIEALPGTATVLTDTVAEWSHKVRDSIKQDKRVTPYEAIVVGYYLDVLKYHPPDHLMRENLVSKDEKMTLLLIQPTKLNGEWNKANDFLEEWCVSPPKGYTLHITGMPAVLSGNGCSSGVHAKVNTRNMSFEKIFYAEVITFPLAMYIMARIVKNWRLLLTALLTIVVSFIVSALCLIPAMDVVGIPKDAPAAMGSVITACCFDYTLFLLSRFSEQHVERWPLQQNVDTIRRYTGRTIAVSGSLVAIAFFSSALLPERNMQGTGFCLGVAVLVCVGTCITLIPAVLLVASKLLTGRSSSVLPDQKNVELHGYIQQGDSDALGDTTRQLHRSSGFWFRVSRMVARGPVASLCIVLAVMVPLLVQLPTLNVTADRFALLPMDMPALKAMRRVQDNFPVGVLDPYAILITSPLQGRAVHLNQEIEDGVVDLGNHDLRAVGEKFGLSSSAIAAIQSAVTDISSRKLDHATLDPKILAAVGAGAAVAVDKAHGRSDEDALKHALHAARKIGCNASDISKAVAAAAVRLHPEGSQPAAEDSEAAVKDEALKLGLSETDFNEIATALKHGAGAGNVHKTTLAAANAGAALEQSKLHGHDVSETLKDSLRALEGLDLTTADVAKVLRAAAKISEEGKDDADHASAELKAEAHSRNLKQRISFMVAAAVMAAGKTEQGKHVPVPTADQEREAHSDAKAVEHEARSDVKATRQDWDEAVATASPLVVELVDTIAFMSSKDHGMLLMPSGFAAMLDLCESIQNVGYVSSMVGTAWLLRQRVDWASAVALNLNSTIRHLIRPVLDSHVNGNRALLEVHSTFPSIGAGGANWVLAVRNVIADWESRHPGYKAELAGGASEAADTRAAIMDSMWTYLTVSISMIMVVVYSSFQSIMVPIRLAVALLFTLGATFGVGAIVYQTPLFHSLFPNLAYFDGISFEVLPLVTGVGIALGLDYDIFLVSRIVEFRLQRFSDRASIFRGVTKTGSVISAAGLIMSLAFSGMLFSNKLLFQQFGVLLIVSVLFDTFIVRTILVPALMLIAQNWNWWPREMPPGIHDVLEGEVESCGGLSRPIMGDTALGDVVTRRGHSEDDWYSTSGLLA